MMISVVFITLYFWLYLNNLVFLAVFEQLFIVSCLNDDVNDDYIGCV